MVKNTTHPLVDEREALSHFLESLLTEPEPQDKVLQTELLVEPLLEVVAEPAVETKVETGVEQTVQTPSVVEEPVTETRTGSETETETTLERSADHPDWADQPFQVMLFKVAGLTLAVPLESLSGVVEWPESLTEMPGHADFFLGVLQHLDRKVPVVDTARLVFPKDKLASLAGDDPLERLTRIVLINDSRWGLACDAVEEVITLTHEQVKWRTERTRRRWLLGTVIDYMCALLDTDAFAEKLATGED